MNRISSIFEETGIQEKKKIASDRSKASDLWDDPKKAERVLKELKYLTDLGGKWEGLSSKAKDLIEFSELVDEESSDYAELVKEYEALEERFDKAHVELLLSGQYDQNDAILVLSAGTGGVDAMDWTDMLLRMYLRFAEKQGWKAAVTEKTDGAEAGIKSASIEISGVLSYGFLKAEHGVHRLVRLSPFNSKNLRQTSFALVEVLPVIPDDEGQEIEQKDLRIDTFKAGGAGGQHVNTTDSAVRITHIPTGLVVSCQSERSQLQNKNQAMNVLRGRLTQKLLEEKKDKVEELKGGYKEAAWGNQIRSYVFQPYTMVKDHRTNSETSQVDKVMDGELNQFIEAYLLDNK